MPLGGYFLLQMLNDIQLRKESFIRRHCQLAVEHSCKKECYTFSTSPNNVLQPSVNKISCGFTTFNTWNKLSCFLVFISPRIWKLANSAHHAGSGSQLAHFANVRHFFSHLLFLGAIFVFAFIPSLTVKRQKGNIGRERKYGMQQRPQVGKLIVEIACKYNNQSAF